MPSTGVQPSPAQLADLKRLGHGRPMFVVLDASSSTPDAGGAVPSVDGGTAPWRLPPGKSGASASATFTCTSTMTTRVYLSPGPGTGARTDTGTARVTGKEECQGVVEEVVSSSGRIAFRFRSTNCQQVGVPSAVVCSPSSCSGATLQATTSYRQYLASSGADPWLPAVADGYAPPTATSTARLIAGPTSASISQVFYYPAQPGQQAGDVLSPSGTWLLGGAQITRAQQSCTAAFRYE